MPFNIALSGLNAASADLNVTANNIANVNTTGFKGSRAEFSDVFAVSNQNVSNTATGNGVQLATVAQQFGQGNIEYTNNSLDLALSGEGFFSVRDNSGISYTRAGSFTTNNQGYVVNAQGQNLQVFPPLATGGFDLSRTVNLQELTTQSAPQATNNAQLVLNLPANATPPTTTPFNPADPTSYNQSTSFTVYDSLGATHTATVYFANTGSGTWNSYLYVDGSAAGGAQPMTFNQNGALSTPAGGALSFPAVNVNPAAAPLTVSLNMGQSTQYGNSFAVGSINQNGYPTGTMSGIDISADGVVSASFSNGQTQSLGQLAIANFANPQGLQQEGNTQWRATYASGAAVMGAAGSGTFGQIQSGALEDSNVDITAQLVNMIQAQRNFQANAQMIQADGKVTQDILSIAS
jgi:flagellar hook protein FlgE